MGALSVIAGPRARRHLLEQGLSADQVSVMVGASGGPKWFCLYGLDQYLFGDVFARRPQPLHLIGSSSGAWRFTCFSRHNPVQASQDFARAYCDATFPKGSSVADISRLSHQILDAVIPDAETAAQIIANERVRLNLVVARARHINASSNSALQATGLGLTALANVLHRRTLGAFFERVLFHHPAELPPFAGLTDLPTRDVALSADNLRDAVLASGAIPMVLEGVRDIAGAGPGIYYDGGVTDYHFDIPFTDDGLVLYPHFYPYAVPGWFDKGLPWRRAQQRHYDNVIMLCPSTDWVARLPYGKIPDRKDFAALDDDSRKRYWRTTMDQSMALADELCQLIDGQRDWASVL